MSAKVYLSGWKRAAPTKRHGTRTALYLRVSTAEQKPDLQYDGLRGYASRAGLDVVQDYCDVAASGRREGRPRHQRSDDGSKEPRDRLRARVEVRSLCSQHPPPARCTRGVRSSRSALRQRPRSGRYRQPHGPGDVHHHWRHGRTGTLSHQRACHRRNEIGRPATRERIVSEIEKLATSTDLSIRAIQRKIAGRASRSIVVGEITKRARAT